MGEAAGPRSTGGAGADAEATSFLFPPAFGRARGGDGSGEKAFPRGASGGKLEPRSWAQSGAGGNGSGDKGWNCRASKSGERQEGLNGTKA